MIATDRSNSTCIECALILTLLCVALLDELCSSLECGALGVG